ncbi:hypothetical protein [Streptomyces rochei]|uniref:hypothetical protein n=1 Tax=Streptomyces rochei TaxID=1928 RepID=UPI0034043F03
MGRSHRHEGAVTGAVVVAGPVAAGTRRATRSGSAQAPATPVGGTRGGEAFLPLAGRGLHER